MARERVGDPIYLQYLKSRSSIKLAQGSTEPTSTLGNKLIAVFDVYFTTMRSDGSHDTKLKPAAVWWQRENAST